MERDFVEPGELIQFTSQVLLRGDPVIGALQARRLPTGLALNPAPPVASHLASRTNLDADHKLPDPWVVRPRPAAGEIHSRKVLSVRLVFGWLLVLLPTHCSIVRALTLGVCLRVRACAPDSAPAPSSSRTACTSL